MDQKGQMDQKSKKSKKRPESARNARNADYYIRLYRVAKKQRNTAEGRRSKLLSVGERLIGSYDDIDMDAVTKALSGRKMSDGDKNVLTNYAKARQVMDVIETAVEERMTAHADICRDVFLNGMRVKDIAVKYDVTRRWISKVKRKGLDDIIGEIRLRKTAGYKLSTDLE